MHQAGPHTPEIVPVHPFGRIPALRDGDLTLFETGSIVRYVEESLPGPALLPDNIRDRARVEAWVSAISSYCYVPMIRNYVLQYIFPKRANGRPDRGMIDAAARQIPGLLARLESAYGERNWQVGNACTMADLFIAPILAYVEMFPEGKQALDDCLNVRCAFHPRTAAIACAVRSTLSVFRPATQMRPDRIR